jgi:hypothetical protein
MNCAEFEQLIDAYLDGELAGSLRVEFDAHRLRCRRCQLTMVAMESVETVVANDRPPVTLSDDFTERVMGAIERRRPLSVRLRPTRLIVAAGVLLQAAALFFLAVRPWHAGEPSTGRAVTVDAAPIVQGELAARKLDEIYAGVDQKTERHQALVDEIFDKLEAAGVNVATDLNHLVSYASALPVPDDVARASDGMNGANPLNVLFDVIVPGASTELEGTPVGTDEHAL